MPRYNGMRSPSMKHVTGVRLAELKEMEREGDCSGVLP